MIKKISLAMAAALALILATPALQANDQPATPAQAPAKKKRTTFPFRGKVSAVDTKGGTFTLPGSKGKRVFHITKESRIMRHGKKATLADAQVGEDCGGSVKRLDDGQLQVVSVRFGPKPGTTSKSKSAKE